MIRSAEAYVLDVNDLHDGDRVVTLLTRERGKVRGVARGAKRKHSRFAGQLQPLAKVALTWFERDSQDLVRITSVELLRPTLQWDGDLDALLLVTYIADHLTEFVQENEPGESYFRLLEATTRALREGLSRAIVTRYFETWVLRIAGVFPPPTECAACGKALGDSAAVSASGEGFECAACAGPSAQLLNREVLRFLARSAVESPREMAARAVGAEVLEAVEAVCTAVRRRFLQHELRSYGVLRSVGAGGRGGDAERN
jgi:DNA repair protein RecO (recombination protein O)